MNVLKTEFPDIKLLNRGKVRDVYDLGECLLFVASDRISAFDVIMNDPIPRKGEILSKISEFWFKKTQNIVKNHFISSDVKEYPEVCHKYSDVLKGRSMIVRKLKPFPLECIVRGFVAGSGWKEYSAQGTICGISIPAGLKKFEKLPEPIFTPSTKAAEGHDENIDLGKASGIIGKDDLEKIKNYSIELYKFAFQYLDENGLILADTKFEFGKDEKGEIYLIDEALTPDSSRFWLKSTYKAGEDQMNFDKQVLRDYLESIDWNKQPPAPVLPDLIIDRTADKYLEAFRRVTRMDIG